MKKTTYADLLKRTADFIRVGFTSPNKWNPAEAYALQEAIQKFFALEDLNALESVHLANGIYVNHETRNQIDVFLSESMKIKAIKELRASNKLGLKQSKDCIDKYALKYALKMKGNDPDFSDICNPGCDIRIVTREEMNHILWYPFSKNPEILINNFNIINGSNVLLGSYAEEQAVRFYYLRLLDSM